MKKKSSTGVHIRISFGCSETKEPEHNEKAWKLKNQMKEYKQKGLEEIGGKVALDKPRFLGRAQQRRFYTSRTKSKDTELPWRSAGSNALGTSFQTEGLAVSGI